MIRQILLCLFLVPVLTIAMPTLYGPTGLIEMPTAESIAYKQINAAVDYRVGGGSVSTGSAVTQSANQFFYKFNIICIYKIFVNIFFWIKSTITIFVRFLKRAPTKIS